MLHYCEFILYRLVYYEYNYQISCSIWNFMWNRYLVLRWLWISSVIHPENKIFPLLQQPQKDNMSWGKKKFFTIHFQSAIYFQSQLTCRYKIWLIKHLSFIGTNLEQYVVPQRHTWSWWPDTDTFLWSQKPFWSTSSHHTYTYI